jgi:hypothetical protein
MSTQVAVMNQGAILQVGRRNRSTAGQLTSSLPDSWVSSIFSRVAAWDRAVMSSSCGRAMARCWWELASRGARPPAERHTCPDGATGRANRNIGR